MRGRARRGADRHLDDAPRRLSTTNRPHATGDPSGRAGTGIRWLDVTGPLSPQEHDAAAAAGIGPSALRSAGARHDRPTRQVLGEDLLVALRPATYDEQQRTVQLGHVVLVMSSGAVLVRHEDGPDVEAVRAVLRSLPHPPAAPGWCDVVAATAALVVQGYADVLDSIDDDMREVETAVFGGAAEAPRRIYELSREVIALERATHPLVDVLEPLPEQVNRDNGRAGAQRLRAVAERARRVVDRVDALRAALSDILMVSASLVAQQQNERAAELAEIGVRQNEQVKRISAWAAILVVPTLVTGIYGMNFQDMPELGWRFGYPAVLGVMAALSVGLYVVFRRRGWL
ncbi:CorA family divalent cation transporter [Aquipuribacter sp. MA13-6]|uniref:CorA family divalent cation transporter n=1 Tax=unclassified Aquipuribacter TaxID=2635084 RepID=UPI003EEC2BA2